MKTNEITNRYREGMAGFVIELGRPALGASFKDIEVVAMVLGTLGIEFEQSNPMTELMADKARGKFREDLLGERILSGILEFSVPNERIGEVLKVLEEVEKKISTVFCVGVICRLLEDGTIGTLPHFQAYGVKPRPHGKTNAGMGRL